MLFPPRAAVTDIEAVRSEWDPVMASRVAAHVTLVHDVTDVVRADEVVSAVAAATAPFTVTLTAMARWGRARGIYLGLDDPSGSVGRLHDALAPLETPGWLRHGFRPHLTVVHGRYVSEATAEAAWTALCGWSDRREVRFDRAAVIEMDADGWSRVGEVRFTGG